MAISGTRSIRNRARVVSKEASAAAWLKLGQVYPWSAVGIGHDFDPGQIRNRLEERTMRRQRLHLIVLSDADEQPTVQLMSAEMGRVGPIVHKVRGMPHGAATYASR